MVVLVLWSGGYLVEKCGIYIGKDDIFGFILDRIMFFYFCILLFEINFFYLFYRVVSIILDKW